jgi:sortase (surface protein transpeptidase)
MKRFDLKSFASGLIGAKPKSAELEQPVTNSSIPKRPPGRPPKLMGMEPVAVRDLSPREILQRNIIVFVAVTMAMFLSNLFVFSHIQHASSQEQLRISFTEKLALATAPTSEGDENLILLADGTPVALIEIPELGVSQVVVEGTDSTALRSGPGHRRDTVLPGQEGTSVIMGRASAFGGPFGSIHTLKPGTLLSVVTGQGQHTFKVIGMRYAGEPEPAPAPKGVARLVLETGRGLPYSPSAVTRVDAQMISTSLTYSPLSAPDETAGSESQSPAPSESPSRTGSETAQSGATPVAEIDTGSTSFYKVVAFGSGARLTTPQTLPLEHRALASDVTTVWALVFALQFLILVEILVIWSVRRFGLRKAWVAGIPVVLLASILASDQLVRLLPNLT